MNFVDNFRNELDRIHANHQLRKITTIMAEEIQGVKDEHIELKERLATREEEISMLKNRLTLLEEVGR